MARYNKHEAQEWAWETLKGQWTTLMTPFTAENSVVHCPAIPTFTSPLMARKSMRTATSCSWEE